VPIDLDKKAKAILRENDKGGFTVPTGGMYPYQWNWDSVFVALGFYEFDQARACEELETLFEAQWANGAVPHIVFRRDDPDYFPGPSVWNAGESLPSSGITQPPVAASILRLMWERSTDEAIRVRLAALFPKVLAWHRWFMQCRVPEFAGAVIITHPWESGRDNSVEWDAPAADIDVSRVQPYQRRDLQHADSHMRPTKADYDRYLSLIDYGRGTGWDHQKIATEGPFRVADVGMSMIFLRATRDLKAMAAGLGEDDALAELEAHIDILQHGADYLWDDKVGTYCSRDTITGIHSGAVTNASFLCFYAGVGSERQRQSMVRHWARISDAAKFMLPSLDPEHEKFDDMRYWRGPTWIIVNYMLAIGFEEAGHADWAARLKSDSRDLIAEFGFQEAFSPVTGAGTGGDEFSWTAAMWLAWCGR
jgi:hypothetical protein